MSYVWSDPWVAAIVAAAVRSAPLILVAGAAALLWRQASASTRHLIWVVAIASMLVMPLASTSLPSWRVELLPAPAVSTPAPVAPPGRMPESSGSAPVVHETSLASLEGDASLSALTAPSPAAPRDWGRIAFFVWLTGVVLVAIPMILGRVRVWLLAREAEPATSGPWAGLAASVPASLGLEGQARIMTSRRAAMPMAFGIFHPTVLLPADASHWSFARRRDVLLHELAHVARRDCLTQLVTQIACALYWFDPLVWIAARALHGERERACDDAVVRAGARPSEYASHLLQVARDLHVPRATSLATVCMARRSQLSDRLLAILDDQRSRRVVTRRFAVPAWILAALIIVPAAAFVPVRQIGALPVVVAAIVTTDALAPDEMAAGRGRRVALGAQPPARLFTASDLMGQQTECDYASKKGGNTSINSHDDDERKTTRIHITSNECDLTARMIGTVRFTPDLSDVQSITPGGSFLLTENDAITTRRIDVRAGADGRLTRKFTVDGVERPWDDEGRRWLGTVLVALERRTAFNAETRVPSLFRQGGVDAVMREIGLLSGDHARRKYLKILFSTAPSLNERDTERAIRLIGGMDSDFETAESLIALLKTGKINGNSAAFVDAVRSIDSDFETRRVLTALLTAATPDDRAVAKLLDVAQHIDSDFELAELLLSVSKRGLTSKANFAAYLSAVETIGSDFERRRVLMSLIERVGDPEQARLLLRTAAKIDSDFELASFLVAFANSHPQMNEVTRAAFMQTADSIESEHEYGRVMQSVRGTARRTNGTF